MTRRALVALAVLAVLAAVAVDLLGEGGQAGTAARDEGRASRVADADGCPVAPAYEAGTTLFGLSVSTSRQRFPDAVSEVRATFGPVQALRVFDPYVPPPEAWPRRAPYLDPGTAVVTSFRIPPQEVLSGQHDEELSSFFREAPTDRTIFWSYYHEPEKDIDSGRFADEEFKDAFRHVAHLAAGTCRSDLLPTLILTGHTADPVSQRDWRRYYPGEAYVSVLGWDPYNSATRQPTEYADPDKLFADIRRHSAAAGKPWAIAEVGSGLVPGDDGSRRATWLTDVTDYARQHGAAFVTYFNSTDAVDYRLLDRQSIEAWRRSLAG